MLTIVEQSESKCNKKTHSFMDYRLRPTSYNQSFRIRLRGHQCTSHRAIIAFVQFS